MKYVIGYFLFVLYFLQDLLNIKIEYIENLQSIESYKKWSGLVLLLLILWQWVVSLNRTNKLLKNTTKEKFIEIHKWIGLLLPIAFYMHSSNFGFGILLLLSIVFFVNILLGIINSENILDKKPKFYNIWLMLHIVLSVLIVALSINHLWQVFYYN